MDINEKERGQVFRAFFEEGRLKALPVKLKKRLLVLDFFASRFEQGRRYPEKEVNLLISKAFDDYCTIRRELVDWGFMSRDESGYLRLRPDGWLPEIA